MFKSLSGWCNAAIKIKHRTGTQADGTAIYAEPAEYKVYPVFEDKLVKDKHGREVISHAKFYADASVPVTVDDMLSTDGERYDEIIKVGGYYRGNSTVLDIWVIYL